jgi:hypothetical protein
VFRDIRVSCYDLLFRRELGALLEFEVTNGARKSEVAVDAPKVYEAAGGTNTSFLLYYMSDFEGKRSKDVH